MGLDFRVKKTKLPQTIEEKNHPVNLKQFWTNGYFNHFNDLVACTKTVP